MITRPFCFGQSHKKKETYVIVRRPKFYHNRAVNISIDQLIVPSEIEVAPPHKSGYGQIARWKDGNMAVESNMVI